MYSSAKDRFQNLKVFQLPFWAKPLDWSNNEVMYNQRPKAEVPERFRINRHGLYFDQKARVAWVEGPFGAHYVVGLEHYLGELDANFHKPLTDRAFAALKTLKAEGLLGEDQHVSLCHEEELRGAFKKGVVRKRFLEFCLERKIVLKKSQPLPLP